jgi:cellulose synthase/poly-beta-1,6-N-acetylglucosamine synthase-like glycosyltransferase
MAGQPDHPSNPGDFLRFQPEILQEINFMGETMLITGIVLLTAACLYAGLIGLFTFGWYRKKENIAESVYENGLKVSVIVAARNEEKHIADLLMDLAVQDYPDFLLEVLVVDDHSEDNTIEIVRNIIAERKLDGFKLIENEYKAGKKSAIAAGISKATGDVVLLSDADCRLGPGWISCMVSFFKREERMMIFGPVSYFPEEGLLNRFQSLEFSGLMASGAGAAMTGRPFMCNGANLAYRKEAFLQVGGYNGNEKFISGDDVFLMHKIKDRFGSRAIGFALDRNAIVRTFAAPGLKAFFKQRIRWASKTKGYSDKLAILTAAIVFIFNLFIVAVFSAGFFLPFLFLWYFNCIILKSIIDLPLIIGITGFNNERRLIWWYLPFQLVYPFYVVSAGVCSIFAGKKW